jgi:energy-coupling factor transporter ATP-binding protein EcfA2
MRRPPDLAIFREAPRGGTPVLWRVALVLCVLVANILLGDGWVSAGLAIVGVGLVVAQGGWARARPVLGWTALAALGPLLAWSSASVDAAGATRAALRLAAGAAWVLWLGGTLDWPAVRASLRRLGLPRGASDTLDHAVLHGLLTLEAWVRRRDAAQLRLGRARLPLSSWGHLLGEGALEAVDRVAATQMNAAGRASGAGPAGDVRVVAALEGLSVHGAERPRIDTVNMTLNEGEWLLICGPSGAGKSTLLSLLAGLVPPDDGALYRFGARITRDTPLGQRLDGRVGRLTQNPEHHFLASTVLEDVCWGPLHRGVPAQEAEARARRWLEQLGVSTLAARPVHALSFGEQRRVALAGILILEPELLLLDEPTSGLDPLAAERLVQVVEHAVEHHKTACVWVTHDLGHLPARAGRVALVCSGRVVFDGPRADALTAGPLIAAGLASPPIPPSDRSPC